MKTTKTWFYGLASTIVAITIAGCWGGSSAPPPPVVVPPAAKASLPVALQVVVENSATKLPIAPTAPETVSLSVYGADANKVVNIDGASLYSATNGFAGPLTDANGVFSVYVKPGSPVPSKISLRLVANAKNFNGSSAELVINASDIKTDGTTTSIPVSIPLVAEAAPPPSVKAAASPVTMTSGTTAAAAITTKTADSSAVVSGATVNLGSATTVIPASTKIYTDASKTVALPAGTTSVAVTYSNSTSEESLATIPGNFTVSQNVTGDALATPSVVIFAGYVDIVISSTAADGTVAVAKTLDKPITVTVSIPKATDNPVTGLPAAAGDSIPIWTYNSVTGAWTRLKLNDGTLVNGTLGALDTTTNTFPVPFSTDNLSGKAPGWPVTPAQQCDTASFNVTGAQGYAMTFEATRAHGGFSIEKFLPANPAKPASANIVLGTAPHAAVTVNAYLEFNGALVGTANFPDFCGSTNSMDVTAGVNSQPLPTDVNFTVRDVCSNDATKTTLVKGADIAASASSVGSQTTMSDVNGTATLKLVVGTTYLITGYADNLNYTVVSGTNAVSLNKSVSCQVISGGG